jgi:hypothetical protein
LLGEIQPFISVGGPVVLVVRTLSMRIWRTYGDAASLS